jgi:Holliday junction resolvase-like predicted endonuclease
MIEQKRDANEREIITVARHAGAHVIQMDKSAGFDLLVVHRSGVHIVEVKNPERKWKLTPAEEAQARRVDRTGQTYNVVECAEDMLEVLGMK